MLKGISPLISPALLKVLSEMGHGDEIALADAHFPAAYLEPQVIRADGVAFPGCWRASCSRCPWISTTPTTSR